MKTKFHAKKIMIWQSRRKAGSWLLILLLFSVTTEARGERIRAVIEHLVTDSSSPYQQELEKVYVQREFTPIWVVSDGLTKDGHVLVETLKQADEQGLNPRDYDQSELRWLERTVQLFSEDEGVFRANILGRFDVILSTNFLKFLDHASGGRISPNLTHEHWYLEDERPPLPQLLSKAIQDGIKPTVASLAGGHEGFTPFLEHWKQYRHLKADGGWPEIADGPLLAEGSSGSRVTALRQRLKATGDLTTPDESSLYDQEVVHAVKQFQARHGLQEDGMVGPQTLQSLNVPVGTRLQQLLVNLERRRWMPSTFGSEFLFVNIPEFRLRAFRKGELRLSMSIIAGKPVAQTPIFSDRVKYLVFHPYWYVPSSIAQEEIFPQWREDATYFEEQNFEVVDTENQPVEMEMLTEENIANHTVRIRQKPGPNNALGSVKFMFPNDHAIYLHDTPADQLFEESERDLSYGCIRVARPTDLAEFLLNGKWTREEILYTLEDSERKEVSLPQPIPVYLVYLTAWVDAKGTLHFREDVYGHDEGVWAALHSVAPDAVQSDSEHSSVADVQNL